MAAAALTLVGTQADQQRARRDRIENRARKAQERGRSAELLLVEALNALAERDAAVVRCEARAGRALLAVAGLGYSIVETVAATDFPPGEVRRLRQLARDRPDRG